MHRAYILNIIDNCIELRIIYSNKFKTCFCFTTPKIKQRTAFAITFSFEGVPQKNQEKPSETQNYPTLVHKKASDKNDFLNN